MSPERINLSLLSLPKCGRALMAVRDIKRALQRAGRQCWGHTPAGGNPEALSGRQSGWLTVGSDVAALEKALLTSLFPPIAYLGFVT